ncbi:MAG: serine/threonine-protein kinase [Deltaproteobacteria bacterium]
MGDFAIHAVLGQGGSGVVYDAAWGPRRVALKVLHAELVGTGKERAQFLAEAQRLQQIGHPAVVKVLAVGTLPDGRPYLAMERLEGETLAAAIARGPFALDRALELFGELCSAVSALHDQGLVHRDLKPENVFVTAAGGHAVLLDFGIAKDLAAPASTTTQEGHVRGTPAYMAPERFFGQPAGLATDVYELALVLYAMLAGRLPWLDAADPEARLSPLPLTGLASVPEPLDIEIRRALSTRAQNRPASAAALLAAVTSAIGAAVEPKAGETARMRPGSNATTGSGAVAVKLGEQATPLAWAPTLAAPTTRTPVKRWPWIAFALAVVAAAGVFAYARFTPHAAAVVHNGSGSAIAVIAPDAHELAYDPNDPWSAKPEAIARPIPLVGAEQTTTSYRAAAANAIAHLASDTNVVIAVQIDELRANTATADVLKKLGTNPKVKLVVGDLPVCVRALAGESEWMVFGAPKLETSNAGELVVGGRWRKQDVIACFEGAETQKVKDGTTLVKLGDDGWLDFLDDHTAYLALRKDLTAEALHALVKKPVGAATATRALLAKLPADRTIAFVFGGKANVDWSSMLLLPNGSDVFGWARITDKGMDLDAGADTHDEKAAKDAAAIITPQIDQMFSSSEGAGKLVVARDATEVHVKGAVTTFTLSLMSAAIDR